MKLFELPDDFTTEQFKQLDKESLDQIPYDLCKKYCQCKGCKNGTKVRDYGLGSTFFLHRNSKDASKNPSEYWLGKNNYWICGKHRRFWDRLEKQYGFEATYKKLLDLTGLKELELIKKVNATTEFIETSNY